MKTDFVIYVAPVDRAPIEANMVAEDIKRALQYIFIRYDVEIKENTLYLGLRRDDF